MTDAANIMRLKDALREAYTNIAWNAYHTGHVDKNGMFDHCCMSDPAWLQGAITGSRQRIDSVPADWLKEQISALVDEMVLAAESGLNPYDACLGRMP